MKKQRLDKLLVERGLADSRSEAQTLIVSGRVLLEGKTVKKVSFSCSENAKTIVLGKRKYVSRGGEKLAGALKDLNLSPVGKVCADVGASTGGFTDCLLQAGAVHIYAIDTGTGQLAQKLQNDERVTSLEKTNARYLINLPENCDLIVMDVSFISLTKLLPNVINWLKSEAEILALVKPQFELGPGNTNHRGVISKPEKRKTAIVSVLDSARSVGLRPLNLDLACLRGSAGNQEYFTHLGWNKGEERKIEDLMQGIETPSTTSEQE